MLFLSPIYLYVNLSVHIYVTYKPFINPLCSLHSTWKSTCFKYMNVILHGCKLERKPKITQNPQFIVVSLGSLLPGTTWLRSRSPWKRMAGTPQVIEGLEDHLPFQLQKSCIFLMPCVFRLNICIRIIHSYIVAHKFGYLFKHGLSLFLVPPKYK